MLEQSFGPARIGWYLAKQARCDNMILTDDFNADLVTTEGRILELFAKSTIFS